MINLTITPVENVDYVQGMVVDNSKVSHTELEWDDPIRVYSLPLKKETNVIAHSVSMYDHRLVLEGKQHHILHFYSAG
jgi:hypothetical protein